MNHVERRIVRTLTDEEEARVQAGIAQDPDNPELTDEELAAGRPFAEVFPEMAASIEQRRRARKGQPTKLLVSLRLDPDVIAAFRAGGPGWQSRINAALRRAVAAQG